MNNYNRAVLKLLISLHRKVDRIMVDTSNFENELTAVESNTAKIATIVADLLTALTNAGASQATIDGFTARLAAVNSTDAAVEASVPAPPTV